MRSVSAHPSGPSTALCLRQYHHGPGMTSSSPRLELQTMTVLVPGPEVKDAATIAAMRVAGRIAAQAMEEVGRHIAPGVTTDELDRIGHEFLIDHGAYPSTLGYKGYPKSLCTSINEVITAYIGGVHGDTDATYLVGEVDEESRLLVERTREATMRAIRAVAPGRQLNIVGRVISAYARRFGYGVVRDFTGHGIGA